MCQSLFKNSTVYRKRHKDKTMENEINELKQVKAYKYLDVEESHNIEHKKSKKIIDSIQ